MIKWNIDELVDKVMGDLDGQYPDWRIREVVTELAVRYEGARVRRYVPIIIRQEAIEQLRASSKTEAQDIEVVAP